MEAEHAPFQSTHSLYLKVVDDRSTYMLQLFDRVAVAPPAGIAGEVDRWRTDAGGTVTDHYLEARTPEVIERYLASDPALAVPPDRELAFERVDADHWRTYLLLPAAELDATAIAHAEASRDANTDRPTVLLDFTPPAAQHFGDLTARITGHKLAVLVDGTVVSAPVINAPITGGRAAVTFGPNADDATAQALADALDAPPR
jgi:preprotein translocase subunit SecD